ncbi:MAG: hypothetical protein AAFN74_08430, partial [Myxococcota bacterium]
TLEKSSYSDVLEAGWAESDRIPRIRQRMQDQHKALLKKVTEGAFEAKVDELIGKGEAGPEPVKADHPSSLPMPAEAKHEPPPLPVPPPVSEPSVLESSLPLPMDESDFLSSLDAEVRRHIETTDTSLPPFDSTILPAEPPPILPRSKSERPGSSIGGRTPAPATGSTTPTPIRSRRPRPAPRDTLVDEPSPFAASLIQDLKRAQEAGHVPRRPGSTMSGTPMEQEELRRTAVDMGLPMPGEPGHGDPNATLLELDAVALKARLAEQRAKLKRASEVAEAQWAKSSANLPSETTERMTVTERSLDEVLLSYLDDE